MMRISWQRKRNIEELNCRLRKNPKDDFAWLLLLEERGNLGYYFSITSVLERLMRRKVVSRAAILEALVDEEFEDPDRRFSVVPVETSDTIKFDVRDEAGAVVGTFDSVVDAGDYVHSAHERRHSAASLTAQS